MRLLFSIFLFLSYFTGFSTSSGPNNPSSSGINNSVGTINWNNTFDIVSSNNVRATTDLMSNGDISYYLIATDFNFSLPNSTINGIVVEIEKRDGGGSGNIKDNMVKIVKGGIITGNNNSSGGNWSSVDTYSSYGSNSDLWGTTWTYTDINSSNFGIAISIKKNGAGTNDGEVDNVRITIYYTTTLPVELLYFNGEKENEDKIKLSWSTVSEINNDYFSIEKSYNGLEFQKIVDVKGKGNNNLISNYDFIDTEVIENLLYYRLKQTDFDGKYKYYPTIIVNLNLKDDNLEFKIISDNKVLIHNRDSYNKIIIVVYTVLGEEKFSEIITDKNQNLIDLSNNLNPGIYLVIASSDDGFYMKKIIIQ